MITISPLTCYITELDTRSKVRELHKLATNYPMEFFREYEKILEMFIYISTQYFKLSMSTILYGPPGVDDPQYDDDKNPEEDIDFIQDNLIKLYKVLSPQKYVVFAYSPHDFEIYARCSRIIKILHKIKRARNTDIIPWKLPDERQ